MVPDSVPDKRARGVDWYIEAHIKDPSKPIVPVQEMPRPPNSVRAEVVAPLSAVCPDAQVGSLLIDGVHPRNKRQEATVVCPNHKSSTEYHELVGKAHREENEAGRSTFHRPSSAFKLW